MSNATTPAYPASCPHCQQASGWPFAAGTCDRPDVIVVKLRCRVCGGEWSADAPRSTPASVRPSLDRKHRKPTQRSA